MRKKELTSLIEAGEIPYHWNDGCISIDETVIQELIQRAASAAAEELAEKRRIELDAWRRIAIPAAVSADKQLRQRTGLDDHLEVGEYRHPKLRNVPASPVITQAPAR